VSEPEEKLMDWVSSAVLDPEGSITTCWEPDVTDWYPLLVPKATLFATETLLTSTSRFDSSGTAFMKRNRVLPPPPHPALRRIVAAQTIAAHSRTQRRTWPTVHLFNFESLEQRR
jgi:hypothetical protein